MNNLTNKVIVITGATNGIGKAAILKLAEQNPKIIFTYRNKGLGSQLKDELIKINPKINIKKYFCDFSNQRSIRECSEEINNQCANIDILINNAGVVNTEFKLTKDGIENTFAINHIGYFLFTNLILDKIKNSKDGRIINVASAAHHFVKGMNWDDLNYKENFKMGFKAYGQSKLANILFTKHLARKLGHDDIKVNAIHPGGVNTALGSQNKSIFGKILKVLLKPFFRSPLKGAESIIYLATKERLEESGAYFFDSKIIKTSKSSQDEIEAKKLWEVSERLVNQNFMI
tara:strand:+ start:13323 stop:14186 length:864 start_codon:yes stop_codon:yes gene_type:complete